MVRTFFKVSFYKMSNLGQDPREKPTDLQNILQGDDSQHGLNTTLNNTTPSDFAVPGGSNPDRYMDSHNNGDHDPTGRFNPSGGLPDYARGQPGDPTFTRQTAPLMGVKHVDDEDEGFRFGDPANSQTFVQNEPRAAELAPKLGEKRADEPEGDRIGLDPNNLPITTTTTIQNASPEGTRLPSDATEKKYTDGSKLPPENLKSEEDPSTTGPFKNESLLEPPKKCFKLDYRQPLRLNSPIVFVYGLERMGVKYLVMSAMLCLYLGQSGYGISSLLMASITGVAAFYMLSSSVLKSINWQIEKIEGAQIVRTTLSEKSNGETMEWFNVIIEKIWRSIDPQVFAVVEDILEDTISRVTPKIIKAVKVCDFDLGVESPRIEKINVFPPKSGQPSDSIFGEAEFTLGMDRNDTHTANYKPHTSSTPGFSIRFKTTVGAAVDVRGELTKLSGKIRFKIITAPEPPFVSRVTISFIKAPEIETAVMPISKRLNIMRLPMLKTIVNQGVKLGFKGLVDPKSLTIDVPPLMIGALIDTNAIGVVKAEIRGAKNLNSVTGDVQDSYVTFSLSDRPDSNVKSTRVLSRNSDPIWNENLYQLITTEDITNEVFLNIKVWEADKLHSDKLWGSISIATKDAVHATLDKYGNVSSWFTDERVIYDGWAPIDGKTENSSDMHLNFRLSFHPKYLTPVPTVHDHTKTKKAKKEKAKKKEEEKARKELEKLEKQEDKSILKHPMDTKSPYTVKKLDGANLTGEKTMNERPNLENGAVHIVSSHGQDVNRTELITHDHEETYTYGAPVEDGSSDDDEGEPVSPLHTSGILSVKIVKASDLEIIDPQVIFFKKRRHPYKSSQSVSPYADIYINDNKVFRTRTKLNTSHPNWNAVSECFINNFETAYIRISVKTNIDLEENPVIGTAMLKLSDLFCTRSKKSKESIKWVSLSNGIGYGKVLLDLKYKPVKMVLPRELSGADVGTLVIDSIQLIDVRSPMLHDKLLSTKATVSLNVEPKITRELNSNLLNQIQDTVGWFRSNLYLPVMMRYRSAVCIQLSQGSGRKCTARLWMKEIYDYDWQDISVALRNYTDEEASDEVSWGDEGPCGRIVIRLKFVPGFAPVHTELPAFTTDMLGADPFQNDDTRDKAHLLVRHEGTENYAIDPRLDKEQKSVNEPLAPPEKLAPPLVKPKPHQPIILKQTENEEGPAANGAIPNNAIPNNAISNTEERRTSGTSVTFDDYRRVSTGSNTFIVSDKAPSTSVDATLNSSYRHPTNTSDTTNKRQSTLSGASIFDDERFIHRNSGTVYSDNKINQVVETETAGYLDSMQDDLENSKIKKYKLMRKLAKGKDVLSKKVNSLRQGYNSQARAIKAIAEET
ncbi:hypothetical protein MFLAVUS_003219 [Mucor flavus]|uniref:Uncharacterized protein n=1 Tax=Mucor flavus TaxID=439312 RepID=A0ABP9YSG8_9FUNG